MNKKLQINPRWFKFLKKKNGKPNFSAIIILADLINKQKTKNTNKFLIKRVYYADFLKCSTRHISKTLQILEKQKLITRHITREQNKEKLSHKKRLKQKIKNNKISNQEYEYSLKKLDKKYGPDISAKLEVEIHYNNIKKIS